ncbi:MAG: ribose 5-phosphate isomerase B [Peptococcaceae bacterium]|nr:ribose 5-phosphate isomerase B [Peptococcaceae bacterium]
MRVVLGADHGGFRLKEIVKGYIRLRDIEVEDCGTHGLESVDYPDFAYPVAGAVADGRADFGILVCTTGNGMAMAANKVPGIRAALCMNVYMARMSRLHNDANILALGEGVTDDELALEMVDIFLSTEFEQGRHVARVKKIDKMEKIEKTEKTEKTE